MGNSNGHDTRAVTRVVPNDVPVMATVVVDETDSFVDPKQFTIIKNLIDTNLDMFNNYLNSRKTVGDMALYTRELKILIDHSLFIAAVLMDRPVSLQRYNPDSENFASILKSWAVVLAIETENIGFYLSFCNSYSDVKIKYKSLDDPRLTYTQVKTFLDDLMMRRRLNILSAKTHDLAGCHVYRAARFVLEQNDDYDTNGKYLRRLHAIEPLDIPFTEYVKRAGTADEDTLKFFAELNQERYDMLVDKVDWNLTSVKNSNCALFLSDDAFERAMGLVWSRELEEKYRERRAKYHSKTV